MLSHTLFTVSLKDSDVSHKSLIAAPIATIAAIITANIPVAAAPDTPNAPLIVLMIDVLACPNALFNAPPKAFATPVNVIFPSSTPVRLRTNFPIPLDISASNPFLINVAAPSFQAIAPIITVTVSSSRFPRKSPAASNISDQEIVFTNPAIVSISPSTHTFSVCANAPKSNVRKNSLIPVAIETPKS